MSDDLSKKIRMLRESRGLSQREVVEATGIPRNTYARCEEGTAEPRISNIIKLSQFYGISVDWFLGTGEYTKSLPPEDRWEAIRKMLETFPKEDLKEVLSFLKFIEWRINERNK